MARKALLPLLSILLAVSLAGCKTTAGKTSSRPDPQEKEVRNLADFFLAKALSSESKILRSMVLPSQAEGLDTDALIERAFRMKRKYFRIVTWDASRIAVTRSPRTGSMLSTATVTVKLLASNELKPVYVNLHWQRRGGKWYIDAFPEN